MGVILNRERKGAGLIALGGGTIAHGSGGKLGPRGAPNIKESTTHFTGGDTW